MAGEAGFLKDLEESGIVDEALAEGHGPNRIRLLDIIDKVRLIAKAGPPYIIGYGGVDDVRCQLLHRGRQIGTLQRRGPGIKHRPAVGLVDLLEQVEKAFIVSRRIVMILDTDRHPEFGSPPSTFS